MGEHELQAAVFAHLGAEWTVGGEVARAIGPAPHRFLFGAVTLESGVAPEGVAEVRGDICDSFGEFTSKQLHGWQSEPGDLWMTREPGPVAPGPDLPAGVGIRAAATEADLDLWEAASFVANGDARGAPGEMHPAGSLADPGLRFLLAEHEGGVIGTALGAIGTATLTVSAVTVMPAWRRRGIGGALTRAVLQAAPQQIGRAHV